MWEKPTSCYLPLLYYASIQFSMVCHAHDEWSTVLTNISFLLSDNSHMNHFAWTVKHGQQKKDHSYFCVLKLLRHAEKHGKTISPIEASKGLYVTSFRASKWRSLCLLDSALPRWLSTLNSQGVVSLKTLIHLRPINRIKMGEKA